MRRLHLLHDLSPDLTRHQGHDGPRGGFRWWLVALVAVLLAAMSPPARADLYHYEYVGNAFTMTSQIPNWLPNDPTQGRTFQLESINAEFYSATPITAGTTLADITGFSMTITPWYGTPWTLVYPFSRDPCSGCPGLTVTGGFTILDVGFLGEPAAWNLWIQSDEVFPTGRHQILTLTSTQSLDSVSGGYETAVSYSGGLALSPGVWSVTMVVPEPGSWALFVVGLVALTGWAHRRRMTR